jgi:prophage regulatory protein
MTTRFIRMPELRQKVGLSRSQIYRLIQDGAFPTPLKIGPKVAVWPETVVDEWMTDLVSGISLPIKRS